jgi:hypothetical protein
MFVFKKEKNESLFQVLRNKKYRLLNEVFIHIHFCKLADKKRKREKGREKNRSPRKVLGILDMMNHLKTMDFL